MFLFFVILLLVEFISGGFVPPVDGIAIQDLPHKSIFLLLYSPVPCCHSVFLSPPEGSRALALWAVMSGCVSSHNVHQIYCHSLKLHKYR